MAVPLPTDGVESSGSENSPGEDVRANVYALLARLLAAPPSEDLLALLRAIDVGSRDDDDGGLAGAWSRLREAADAAGSEGLAAEYHDLFIGLGRGELVPYGSYYMTGFLMEKPLAALRRDLETLGFERAEGVREPEDHAAALCETMGFLVAGDGETGTEAQRAFFDAHIAPWMGKFFRDLADAETARFYRAVGSLGERFMTFESRYLEMEV